MLRIALCDDEPVFSKQILELLQRYSVQAQTDFDFEFRYFSTAQELMQTHYAYDILFLDIMLEDGRDGIEIGRELRRRGVDAVFFLFTSMERFQDGYRAGVLRYLKKPIDPVDFFEAMNAALNEFQVPRKRLAIRMKSKTIYVSLGEIVMAEIYYRKRTIYTTRGNYVTTEGWNELCERLPGSYFYAPQKTVRINFEHVRESSSAGIVMDNGKRINFSRVVREHYANFSTAFQIYLGG